MSRRRGMTTAAIAVAVAAPLVAGVAYAARSEPNASPPAAAIATGTAPVVRGTLTSRVRIGGALGYSGSYTVDHPGPPGVLTAAPRPGATIGRGGVLYRVADAPVRLLLGAVPVYRDLESGMSDGPDVRQLERNLVAMGFDPHRRITVDRHFSAATAAAIRRWEASWGRKPYQRTGRLGQGQIVFLPTALRVTQVPARVGAPVEPATTVLTGTSTNRAVIGQLDTAELATVRVGARVEVSLPDADPLPGRVAAIGLAATAEAEEDGGAATVPLTITFRPPPGFTLDEAPVDVDIVTGERRNVLLIPIAALLARPGGGYQVRLSDGSVVRVEPASFDENSGQVEIAGGLTEGQSVEVPAT
ncbi:peptidoglycan-binding protein [Paractinoplanes atraurantiacus]|uniref:Multidrug efflux pump subunit AcrA (Membrane-fusion protein) n=1 Tax=Paractinoplanes atraurantiacus TaxID=1036182 RepID=A0A285J394_9ACTN|nr:peptidoglycan-binding protein [Actinoplanes atraurantiacus]SNY53601.1 Multidrug efflux pump subunit AcrA (membrane-fusion protein) [Actinoplanes atraurantiacus]